MNEAASSPSALPPDAAPAAQVPAHVPVVDGLRGAAALLVLVYHCWVFVDPPLGGDALLALVVSGGLGVEFFFVISGFVLFLPVALHGGAFGDVRAYAVRRIARIVPAYYVSLVVQALLVRPLTGFPSPFSTAGGILVVIAHLLFLQHELPASLARAAGFWGNVVGFGVNGVLWSLSIEALFYATLPLVAARFYRRPLAGLVLAVAVGVAWRVLAVHMPPLLWASAPPAAPRLLDQFPAYFGHFAFGMTAALLYVRFASRATTAAAPSAPATDRSTLGGPPRERHSALAFTIAQLVVVAALLGTMIAHGAAPKSDDPIGHPLGLPRHLSDFAPSLAFAILLGLAALDPRGARHPLARPLARWLGDVSYGVFLWHLPVILFVRRFTSLAASKDDTSFVAVCVVVVAVSLTLGWLSRRFVEDPAIRWARRRFPAR